MFIAINEWKLDDSYSMLLIKKIKPNNDISVIAKIVM